MNIWLFNSLDVKKFILVLLNKLQFYFIEYRFKYLLPSPDIAVQVNVLPQKHLKYLKMAL